MKVNVIKLGAIFLFLSFSYVSPICKCWGSKSQEQGQDVVERFRAILERQEDSNLVKNVREFIDSISLDSEDKTKLISKNKNIVKACFSIRLYNGNALLIFSRYAENVEDFGWIIGRMEWCGGRNFVWGEMLYLNTTAKLNLRFFHTLCVVKNFRCVEFMFNMICRYASTPRALRNFLLYKNQSDDCILTCISYSSALSSEEKIRFLDLFVNRIRENAEEIYSRGGAEKNVGDEVELSLLTELNESLLFEVIRSVLVVHNKFGDWVYPFIKKLIELVHDCGGDEAVMDFVNKVKVNGRQSLTALDLLLMHQNDPAVVPPTVKPMMDDLIGFLRSVGAKSFQELPPL